MITLMWILIAYGMTNIIVYGSIFNTPRTFIKVWGEDNQAPFNQVIKFISDLVSCVMCTSTWVGFFLSLTFYSPVMEMFKISEWYSIFLDGMLASGAVWATNSIVEWFEENRPSNN